MVLGSLACGGSSRTKRLIKVARRHPTVQRVALLASIFGSFLVGVIAGTFVSLNWPAVALIPPVLFLVWIIVIGLRRPIADVRELDLFSDPELKLLGIVRSLLPAEVVMFRLARPTAGGHYLPNFEHWLDRIPRRARVVILAITPFTRFDANSAMAFVDTVHKLRASHREIVLAGVRSVHYQALDRLGVLEAISIEDLCPDLEFAIARALEITRRLAEAGGHLSTAAV